MSQTVLNSSRQGKASAQFKSLANLESSSLQVDLSIKKVARTNKENGRALGGESSVVYMEEVGGKSSSRSANLSHHF